MSALFVVIWGIVVLLLAGSMSFSKELSSPLIHNRRRFFVFLMVPVIACIILLFVVFSFSTLHFTRCAHAMCVLGLWLSCVSAVLSYKRQSYRSVFHAVRFILTAVSAIYLTPLFRFERLFHIMPYILPLVLGLILIVLFYVSLIRASGRRF